MGPAWPSAVTKLAAGLCLVCVRPECPWPVSTAFVRSHLPVGCVSVLAWRALAWRALEWRCAAQNTPGQIGLSGGVSLGREFCSASPGSSAGRRAGEVPCACLACFSQQRAAAPTRFVQRLRPQRSNKLLTGLSGLEPQPCVWGGHVFSCSQGATLWSGVSPSSQAASLRLREAAARAIAGALPRGRCVSSVRSGPVTSHGRRPVCVRDPPAPGGAVAAQCPSTAEAPAPGGVAAGSVGDPAPMGGLAAVPGPSCGRRRGGVRLHSWLMGRSWVQSK